MKKCWIFVMLMLLLTGCGAAETFETVSDTYVQPAAATMQQVVLSLPIDASVAVMESETSGTIYLCDGYTVTVHSTTGGDLDKTLREATGFAEEELTLVQTEQDGIKRIQCVWTAAGETEEQIGRLTLLDDGNYHYVLSCMTDASKMNDLQPVWQELFDSFCLISPEVALSIGS